MPRKDDSFAEYVLEQLAPLGVGERRLFGGLGLYLGDAIFGIVDEGRLYFKTDAESREVYVALGMRPFSPSPRQTLMRYYEVPPDVIEDAERLAEWAAT